MYVAEIAVSQDGHLERCQTVGCVLSQGHVHTLSISVGRADVMALELGRLEAGQCLATDRLEEQETLHVATDVIQVLLVHHLNKNKTFRIFFPHSVTEARWHFQDIAELTPGTWYRC